MKLSQDLKETKMTVLFLLIIAFGAGYMYCKNQKN